NVERAIAETFKELGKIRAGEIADEDLALARDKIVGELQVGLESPNGVAGMVLEAELFDLGEDHFDRYPREIRAVTKEDVVAIARAVRSNASDEIAKEAVSGCLPIVTNRRCGPPAPLSSGHGIAVRSTATASAKSGFAHRADATIETGASAGPATGPRRRAAA